MGNKSTRFITSPHQGKSGAAITGFVTVVILGDKIGHRMKSYGPTPLLPLGRATLLDYQLQAIKTKFSNYEVILCTGFDSEKVTRTIKEKYKSENIRVVENQMYHHTNTCESLRLCLNNNTSDMVLICDGGVLMSNRTLSPLDSRGSCVFLEESESGSFEVGATVNSNGNVSHMCYGLGNKWIELTFLHEPSIIESFRRIISSPDFKTKFIFEGINELSKTTKCKIGTIQEFDSIEKINNIKTYHKVRKNYAGTYTKLRNE